MKNRYYFFKKLFPKYVVILLKSDRMYSYGFDKSLIKYINLNEVSYILVDIYNNIDIHNALDNKYDKYLIKEFIKSILVK